MTEQTKPKHNHPEAFMLMTYACDQCGHKEVIWNSRDGVTPFGTGCPSCPDGVMRHVDWQKDTYAPNHKPKDGQKYWRDGTPDEAVSIMRNRLESFKGSQYEAPPDVAAALLEEARVGGASSEFQKGWPYLAVAVPHWIGYYIAEDNTAVPIATGLTYTEAQSKAITRTLGLGFSTGSVGAQRKDELTDKEFGELGALIDAWFKERVKLPSVLDEPAGEA